MGAGDVNWIGKHCAHGRELDLMYTKWKDVTFAASTTGAIASKELFAVTGLVLATVVPVCVGVDLTGSGTIKYGVAGTTDLFLGAITATGWDDTEIGINTTPSAALVISDTQPKWAYINGLDIGYEIESDTITAGVVRWYCFYFKISDDADVSAAGVNISL